MTVPVDTTFSVEGIFVGGESILPEQGHRTGIYKKPIAGRVYLSREGLEGDVQADRRYHGGPERALNHYPFESHAFWQTEFLLERENFTAGSFGENLSTRGVTETTVRVGDILRLGRAVMQVSQPRAPCWKLSHKFGIADLALRVADSGRTGWLYRVLEPGAVAPGDELRMIEPAKTDFTIERIWRAHHAQNPEIGLLHALAGLADLAPAWQKKFRDKAEWRTKQGR